MTAPENNPELARKERRKEAIRHDITYIKEELHTLRSTPRLYDFYQGNIKFAPTLITEGEKRVWVKIKITDTIKQEEKGEFLVNDDFTKEELIQILSTTIE